MEHEYHEGPSAGENFEQLAQGRSIPLNLGRP